MKTKSQPSHQAPRGGVRDGFPPFSLLQIFQELCACCLISDEPLSVFPRGEKSQHAKFHHWECLNTSYCPGGVLRCLLLSLLLYPFRSSTRKGASSLHTDLDVSRLCLQYLTFKPWADVRVETDLH